MAGVPFDAASAVAGQWQRGVDPASLRAGQPQVLRKLRLQMQRGLQAQNIHRTTPVKVTPQGVIFDGHHAVRVAAEQVRAVDVLIVDEAVRPGKPIMQLPVI